MQRARSPAWSVACERAARLSGAVALAAVAGEAGEAVEWLANIGGTIGSGFQGVKSIRTALVRIGRALGRVLTRSARHPPRYTRR